jgi:hypothetical protein
MEGVFHLHHYAKALAFARLIFFQSTPALLSIVSHGVQLLHHGLVLINFFGACGRSSSSGSSGAGRGDDNGSELHDGIEIAGKVDGTEILRRVFVL